MQNTNPTRSSSSPKWWAIGGVSLVAIAVGACWYSGRNQVLSEVPERRAESVPIPTKPSNINLRLAVPFSVLKTAADKQLPPSFSDGGDGPRFCAGSGFLKACIDTHYDYTVSRTSEFAISRVDQRTVRIGLGIRADGRGGIRGDGARILSLDAKNFQAAANVFGNIGIGLKSDWCPDVKMAIGYDWTRSPRVEIVGRVWVELGGSIDQKLKEMLNKLPMEVQVAIPCDKVRQAISEVWRTHAIPIAVENAPPMTILVDPQSIGTSGMIVTDNDIRFVVNAKALTSLHVGVPPPQPAKGPLPPAAATPELPGKVEIVLPINAAYAELKKVALDAVKEPISFDVGGKKGIVTVKDVNVYPSGEKVAVGVSFEADVPGRIFDVAGDVHLTGTPKVSPDGHTITLADAGFSRKLDNGLWNILSAVLEGEVRKRLAEAKLDLKPQVESAKKAIDNAIDDPSKTGGIKITVKNTKVRIESIVPEENSLAVLTTASADVEGELVSPFIK